MASLMRYAALAIVVMLCGCATLKSSEPQPQMDELRTHDLHGRFSCTPSYVSHAIGYHGPPGLASILGGTECDSATLDYTAGPALTVSLERHGLWSIPRLFDAKAGLAESGGKYSLPTTPDCRDGLPLECGDTRVILFISTEGDLVTTQVRGDEGVLARVPERLIGRMMAIFPRQK